MSLKAMDKAALRALAVSGDLPPYAIDFLAVSQDIPTAAALVHNGHVRLTVHAMRALAELSKLDNAIARQLLSRPEVPDSVAMTLYPHVGDDLKAYLRTYFPLETANDDAGDAMPAPDFMPSDNVMKAAEKFARHGLINIPIMLQALERGKIPTFIAFFAKFTGLPERSIHDFLRESCPKGMVIACRAMAVAKSDFTRIYLLTNRMRGADRPINHAEMLSTLGYFDRVSAAAATRLIGRAIRA